METGALADSEWTAGHSKKDSAERLREMIAKKSDYEADASKKRVNCTRAEFVPKPCFACRFLLLDVIPGKRAT
jgi:hypothetical protein